MAYVQLIANEVALTTSAVDSSVRSIEGSSKQSVYVQWTPGTAANVLTVNIYTRATPDSEWTKEMYWTDSGSVRTRTERSPYTHTAEDTDVVPLQMNIETIAAELKIDFKESEDGSSTKGTITAYASSNE